jgi:hypothetical protein
MLQQIIKDVQYNLKMWNVKENLKTRFPNTEQAKLTLGEACSLVKGISFMRPMVI